MELLVSAARRVFILEEPGKEPVRLPDPSGGRMEPDEVINHYAPLYPLLTLAKAELVSMDDKEIVYKMTTTLGSKG